MNNHNLKFPDGFLWGTATAAHQVEGNNKNNDWWEYENDKSLHKSPQHSGLTERVGSVIDSAQKRAADNKYPLEPSGIACDAYNRYEEDFDLCVNLNNNAVRFSVEWSRIEPKKGQFDQNEIEHYKKVIKAARDRNLKVFLTLHHFTNPLWLKEIGRWENFKTPKYFARFAQKCAEEFGDTVEAYLTINEPQVYTFVGYIIGHWPPAKERSYSKAYLVQVNMIRAHKKAYKAIKRVNKNLKVGLVKNIAWYETAPEGAKTKDKIACKILNQIGRDLFLRPIRGYLDVLGLNYYFTNRIVDLKIQNPNDYVSDLQWWINPGGLENILVYLSKKYDFPVYVTENGLADAEDKLREHFIVDHLIACHNAIKQGAKLKGYFYWSLMDNFEWHEGFWPRFGIVEIDRQNNLERKPRPSYYKYAEICKNNSL